MGYPQSGLEVWGYPFQILSDYQVAFRPSGATSALDGRLLLRRIDYSPESVTRIYIGPDFLVREKLFVPLDQAAAIIDYEVQGIRKLEIEVRFQPVLNLMWPGALGGQYTRWSAVQSATTAVPGFVISEPERGFSAAVGSREITTHDDTVNSTIHPTSTLGFSLLPSVSTLSPTATAHVYIALNPSGTKDPTEALQSLSTHLPQLEDQAIQTYLALHRNALHIRTPDENVNQSLAWSITALDQAWVCNSLLGCGIVAGYGPSRDARRPQYAWFFGGDGLVATEALISVGEYSRAKEELTFIQKYQDAASGMVWHELSQSAGFIDWSKFPYMYVHVDISFDYLATVARYVSVTGDVAFANDRWQSIASAYRYCQTQIRASNHLPYIPADKEASDEQHRPADDLSLSASWMAAASGFAELAHITGHTSAAEAARREVQLTRQSIPLHYWNTKANFWFDGHTQSGEPIFREAVGPSKLLTESVFPAPQNEAVLNRLASADFQADWGIREVAASSKDYNPYSYGAGSISALGTSGVAATLWKAHRPESALGLWNGVVQWNTFDSFGHLHEVFAGNFFHEQTESVPEQTWSSAGLLDATVRGLLGLDINGITNSLQLAPHLPPDWHHISVDNIRLPHSLLGLRMNQSMDSIDLELDNRGNPTAMIFEPQIPLGADIVRADFQGHRLDVKTEMFSSDQHARLAMDVPSGVSHLHLSFQGGVSVFLDHPGLRVGDSSSELKIVALHFRERVLSIEADIQAHRKFRIRSPWKITTHPGANIRALPDSEYEVEIVPASQSDSSTRQSSEYARAHAELSFASQ